MKYFYSVADMNALKAQLSDSEQTYFTAEDIRQIELLEETPEILESWTKEDSDLWPVSNPYGRSSYEPAEYEAKEDAYNDLLAAENQAIYEYIHDI